MIGAYREKLDSTMGAPSWQIISGDVAGPALHDFRLSLWAHGNNVAAQVTEDSPDASKARALLRRMAQGDEEALGELYVLYHRPLSAIAARILPHSETSEIEEVLQDTFLRAWRNAGRYDPERAGPFGWLVLITRRLCLDRLRKKARRPVTVAENWEQSPPRIDSQEDGETARIASSNREAIRSSLESLSPRQREYLELAFFQGHTHREIAQLVGRPLGSVKSDLRRALAQLRVIFSRDG